MNIKKSSKIITTLLTIVAYLMAWFVIFSIVVIVLFNIAGTVTVLSSVYDNINSIIIFFFVICLILIFFSMWFADRYFRNN